MNNCLTCKYWEFDVLGHECRPCKYTNDGMTGWVAADKDKEEKTVKEQEKTLSEYSIEELKTEIEKRERDAEKKKEEEAKNWLDTFIIGDYYKITLKDSPKRFIIVRAEKVVTNDRDIKFLSCVNVYDHGMGWIRIPAISPHFKTTTRYIVEHIIEGTGHIKM